MLTARCIGVFVLPTLRPRMRPFFIQAGLLRFLSTGNLAIDIFSAAVLALGIHVVMPKATVTGNIMFDVLVLASIPIFRTRRAEDCLERITEYSMALYAQWRRKYVTTIEFEREVRSLVECTHLEHPVCCDVPCDYGGKAQEGCQPLLLRALGDPAPPFGDTT